MLLNQIDPSSPEPLYRQVRKLIEREVMSGRLDGRLPSSRTLAAELGISRNTVQIAYQELLAEGYVSSKPRSGLSVNREMRALVAREQIEAKAEPEGAPDWGRLTKHRWRDLPQVRKPTDWHRYPYKFTGGQVDADEFPRLAWMRALRRSLDPDHRRWSLQDSQSADDPMLVDAICRSLLPGRGISASPDEVLVTTGSQAALYLTADALCRPGMPVAVESPGYPDAWQIFDRYRARLLPQPVDPSGMRVTPSLAEARLVYVTPSHQFPTNATLSIARRRRLLSLAATHDLLVLEDDYDSEFRYKGHTTPALKAIDTQHRVVYFGSFSKFLAPGIRLGFVVGHPELITNLRMRRRLMVRHPPGQLQRALALFIDSGDYARSVSRMRSYMKSRWRTITEAAADHLPCEFSVPAGGTSLWLQGATHLDARRLASEARSRGLLFEPGETFFLTTPRPSHFLKLGYASIAETDIVPGVRLLASLMRQQPVL